MPGIYEPGGAGGGEPAGGTLVDVFSDVTDGSTGLTTTSGTLADISGLLVTVTDAQVGDIIHATVDLVSFTTSGSASIGWSFTIDGTGVRGANYVHTQSVDTNSRPFVMSWNHTLTTDDITAGECVVRPQWAKTGGTGTCTITNGNDGIAVLTVTRVRN